MRAAGSSHYSGGSTSTPGSQGAVGGLGANAPSMLLPMRFMLLGIVSLLVGGGLLVARPELLATYHYNQHIIAVTHLFVLGWMLTIVMGATYQLVPVALETHLHSERLARWQFLLHAVGFVGMVITFWTWRMTAVAHFGSVLAAGVVLYAYNLARTLWRVPRWTVVATAVASAVCWLVLGVSAGLVITAGKCVYDSEGSSAISAAMGPALAVLKAVGTFAGKFDQISAMHAHAHLGAVGVFLMLIVGISYKLIPMFTLSEVQSPRRASGSVVLLNAGLAVSFLMVAIRSPYKIVGTLLITIGLALYGLEMLAILRARKRKSLDWGVRSFLTAVSLLVPVCLLALVLSWPKLPLTTFTGQLENLYGFVGFMGVISLAIIGMLYKILPFLAWFHSYSAHVGLAKVPALADLYSARLQKVGYWSYLAGLFTVCGGILGASHWVVRAGSCLLALSLGILALNILHILSHWMRPKIQPLENARAQKRANPNPSPGAVGKELSNDQRRSAPEPHESNPRPAASPIEATL